MNLDKKFVESFDASEWEVETETGFKDIIASHKTIKYVVYKVELEDDYSIECADNHIFIDEDYKEVFAIHSKGRYIRTKNGPKKVLSVERTCREEHMYDLEVNSEEHTYYTNDILSHNTQVVAAFITHYSIFSSAKTSAVLAHKASQAQEILERIQLSYELLPLFLQPGVRVYNKQSMTLGNNSKIFSASSSSSSVRGKSISLLYVDECAFIPNDMKFYESTYPTVSSGKNSIVIISSTPNGMRGLFYKLWTEAVSGQNEFFPIKVYWHQVPGRDEAWKQQTIANTSKEQFRQEHELVFRGSANSLITGEILEQLVHKKPIQESSTKDLRIYANPEKGREYLMTVDVSRGLGQDYHAFTVFDISEYPHQVVCTYRNNVLSPMLYPTLIHNVATKYNNAHVLVELNDLGEQVANFLADELEYENLLHTVKAKRGSKQTIGFGPGAQRGVKTSNSVKAVGCSNAKTLVEEFKVELNDTTIIDELGTMVPKGGSYAADDGMNDDAAMTVVLYGWAMTQPYFMDLTNIDARRKVLQAVKERAEETVMPFGIISNGVMDDFDGTGSNDPFEEATVEKTTMTSNQSMEYMQEMDSVLAGFN